MPVRIIRPTASATVIATGNQLTPASIPDLVSYKHTQNSASDTWTISHNLGFVPSVTVVDSGGSIVEANITFSTINDLTISLSTAVSGIAYLS